MIGSSNIQKVKRTFPGTFKVTGWSFAGLLLLVQLGLLSCKEVYKVELKNNSRILVVDGMVTDELRSNGIRLTRAIRFDTTQYIPEQNALVFVQDTLGNTYSFKEKIPGYYVSDSVSFIPRTGLSYTLTILTADHKIYKSSAQKLLPKGNQQEPMNRAERKPYYLTIGGKLRAFDIDGAEFYTDMDMTSGSAPYYRFANTVFVEYTSIYKSLVKEAKDTLHYCWKKYDPNPYFNITDPNYLSASDYRHHLGFLPLDSNFHSINLEITSYPARIIYKDVFHYLVSFKQHHINKDVYNYYSALNKLLAANSRILDQRPFQVQGNVRCISDTSERVFGIFEVSSVNTLVYRISRNRFGENYVIRQINFDVDNIPDEGIVIWDPPPFWVF